MENTQQPAQTPQSTNPAPQQQPRSSSSQPTPAAGQLDTKDIEENKLLAAISYIGIISVIVYFAKKDSAFAQFHAKQGMALFGIWVILFMAGFVIGLIPWIGWLIGLAIFFINMGVFITALIGLIQAVSGKYWKLPVIGDAVEKMKI